MPQEIERKFILEKMPDSAHNAPVLHLEQGYLAIEPGGHEVRLRRSGDQCWLTVKTHGDLARGEYETPISTPQFLELWPATAGRRIRKDRHLLDYEGLIIEVDAYHQPLRGLIVAEVEFPSKAAAGAFHPPSWMGREVTHLNFLKNRHLLQFPSLDELQKWLGDSFS